MTNHIKDFSRFGDYDFMRLLTNLAADLRQEILLPCT